MSYQGLIKKLYRRAGAFYNDSTVRGVGTGLSFTWTFDTPGYISFDYMCNVPSSSGELADKYFTMYVDGVKRFEVRAAWAWSRSYIYVDAGVHTVTFDTSGYGGSDYANIRRITLREFVAVNCLMVEAATMPKPLESINIYPILSGWQRYQRTGKRGTELEFVVVFDSISDWQDFMASIEQQYVIKGDYGVYGGVILPQDIDTIRQGKYIFTKVKMNSPLTAGVGVEGM
jgi:hypothetical protein